MASSRRIIIFYPKKNELKNVLGVLEERVISILSTPIHIHYTDHSINHSNRILTYISDILKAAKLSLTDIEGFILIAAAYLHDIGMQTPRFENDEKSITELTDKDLEEIRKNHHIYTEKFIFNSLTESPGNRYYLGLDGMTEYVETIAEVAKYHRKFNIDEVENEDIGGDHIRTNLLCALMRLGDALDIDFRRVFIDKLKVFSIPTESKFHWFTHHYIKSVVLTQLKVQITLQYPEEYQSNEMGFLRDFIKEHVENEISDQIDELYDLLDNNGIRIYRSVIFKENFSKFKSLLPDDLFEFIKKTSKKLRIPVLYEKYNIKRRKTLMQYYHKSIINTKSYRTMVMGPYFLSPDWFLERKNLDRNYKDFELYFYNFLLDNNSETIKIISTNTKRYGYKILPYLEDNERKRFVTDVKKKINKLWPNNNSKGPMLCCFDPGYLHIITVSDQLAIITQRLGYEDPTTHGFYTSDTDQLEYIRNEYDGLFDHHHSGNDQEILTLIEFIEKTILGEN